MSESDQNLIDNNSGFSITKHIENHLGSEKVVSKSEKKFLQALHRIVPLSRTRDEGSSTWMTNEDACIIHVLCPGSLQRPITVLITLANSSNILWVLLT